MRRASLVAALLAAPACALLPPPPPARTVPVHVEEPPLGMDCPAPAATAGNDVAPGDRGFTPVESDALLGGSLTNQTLFMGVSTEGHDLHYPDTKKYRLDEPAKDPMLLAGDPVTVCVVVPANILKTDGATKAEIKTPGGVVVKTAAGERRLIPATQLSTTPLAYSLRHPGSADQLVRDLFAEGLHDGKLVNERMKANQYASEDIVQDAGQWKVPWAYSQGQAFEKSMVETTDHLRYMVHGRIDRASIMRSRDMAWIVKADDSKILDWHVDGVPAAEKPASYDGMLQCVQGMGHIHGAGMSYASKLEEMKEKRWRKGLLDASEEKLATLDKAEMARLQKDADRFMKIIADQLGNKGCKEGTKYVEAKRP
jgi:hypothetical protein